jgi:hypothetical protein
VEYLFEEVGFPTLWDPPPWAVILVIFVSLGTMLRVDPLFLFYPPFLFGSWGKIGLGLGCDGNLKKSFWFYDMIHSNNEGRMARKIKILSFFFFPNNGFLKMK